MKHAKEKKSSKRAGYIQGLGSWKGSVTATSDFAASSFAANSSCSFSYASISASRAKFFMKPSRYFRRLSGIGEMRLRPFFSQSRGWHSRRRIILSVLWMPFSSYLRFKPRSWRFPHWLLCSSVIWVRTKKGVLKHMKIKRGKNKEHHLTL